MTKYELTKILNAFQELKQELQEIKKCFRTTENGTTIIKADNFILN
ncbi:hypothetical protein [Flagellimonas onchidii]|nr:hypothetical protein [Allomuricauda onchidii]